MNKSINYESFNKHTETFLYSTKRLFTKRSCFDWFPFVDKFTFPRSLLFVLLPTLLMNPVIYPWISQSSSGSWYAQLHFDSNLYCVDGDSTLNTLFCILVEKELSDRLVSSWDGLRGIRKDELNSDKVELIWLPKMVWIRCLIE